VASPTPLPLKNSAKERMQTGEAALGFSVRMVRSPDIARIARASGHDVIFIDAQHGAFNRETIVDLSSAALAVGIAPIVRVRGVDDPDVAVLLDNCAAGIVYPDIDSAADARKAVSRARFAPLGKRSIAGAYPQFGYRSVPPAESLRLLGEHCLVVCMVETEQGLRNLDEIAAVEGIDVIHLGVNDMLASIGKPGKFDDPVVAEAQQKVLQAAKKNGKYAGCAGIRDLEKQLAAICAGFRFITTQSDAGLLYAGATRCVESLRGGVS
jgi:2-keto-3-deoxy-L-rhamnonate aldolase RhmA